MLLGADDQRIALESGSGAKASAIVCSGAAMTICRPPLRRFVPDARAGGHSPEGKEMPERGRDGTTEPAPIGFDEEVEQNARDSARGHAHPCQGLQVACTAFERLKFVPQGLLPGLRYQCW